MLTSYLVVPYPPRVQFTIVCYTFSIACHVLRPKMFWYSERKKAKNRATPPHFFFVLCLCNLYDVFILSTIFKIIPSLHHCKGYLSSNMESVVSRSFPFFFFFFLTFAVYEKFTVLVLFAKHFACLVKS